MSVRKESLEKIVEIFNTGDVTQVDKVFSKDYVDHQKPPHIKVDGPEEFEQVVEGARKSLSNLRVTIEDVIEGEDKLAARLHWKGVDQEGEKVERETIEILHFEEGLVIEHWGAESWRKSS